MFPEGSDAGVGTGISSAGGPQPHDIDFADCSISAAELGHFYEERREDVRATVSRIVRNSRHYQNDVDDLVQMSFLRFLDARRSGKIDPSANVSGYLATIARNVAIDWVLCRRRERVAPKETDGTTISQACESDRAQISEERLDVSKVRAYVAGLPFELLNIYILRFDRQLSQLQTARNLGISRQQVRTLEGRLLHEGRHALRLFDPP